MVCAVSYLHAISKNLRTILYMTEVFSHQNSRNYNFNVGLCKSEVVANMGIAWYSDKMCVSI